MKTAVIVQARMSSQRLPGKSMMDLCGKPVIQHVLERCLQIGADVVVLAVPEGPESAPMVDVARTLNVHVYWGSETDVLSRYVGAAKAARADIIMRVTGDCPMIDPKVCRKVLDYAIANKFSYTSNVHKKRTYPKGFDCEVFTMETLLAAAARPHCKVEREHVTAAMTNGLHTGCVWKEHDESHINYCVDTQGDLDRMRGVMSLYLYPVSQWTNNSAQVLWEMLLERNMDHSISHKKMPKWDHHTAFVSNHPYEEWYLIKNDETILGNIYLTKQREVGLFLFKHAQGQRIGTLALEKLRMQHPGPLYANISPNNEGSMRFFERHGFVHIQNTLKLEE